MTLGTGVILSLALSGLLQAQLFAEVARETGLDFQHFNGMTGKYRLSEVTGSGVALFDYDRDGDLDAYWVQGAMLDSGVSPSIAGGRPRRVWEQVSPISTVTVTAISS